MAWQHYFVVSVLSVFVRLCASRRCVVSFVLIASISVERSSSWCRLACYWQWDGSGGHRTAAITRHQHSTWALMKTDAMNAAAAAKAAASGGGSAAGNIVVGSQLQIVGAVSTRDRWPTDRRSGVVASYWSVRRRQRHLSTRGQAGRRQGLIPGGQRCRGLAMTAGDDDVTRNDPLQPAAAAATSTLPPPPSAEISAGCCRLSSSLSHETQPLVRLQQAAVFCSLSRCCRSVSQPSLFMRCQDYTDTKQKRR